MWSCGWDFHKPSQNLVNAFKTQNGLPMFDSFNDTDIYPVNGIPSTQKWDPRLFHTVGMPTFPYKYEDEYIMTLDNSRTPNTYGYYTSLKEVPQRSAGETFEGSWQAFAMNDYVIRYTDVMLMRRGADRAWTSAGSPRNHQRHTPARSQLDRQAHSICQRVLRNISLSVFIFRQQGNRTRMPALGATPRNGHGKQPLLRSAPMGHSIHCAERIF